MHTGLLQSYKHIPPYHIVEFRIKSVAYSFKAIFSAFILSSGLKLFNKLACVLGGKYTS